MSVSLCFALLRKKYIPSQLSFSSRYPSYFLLSRYHGLSGLTLMLAVSVRTLIMYFLRRNATRDEMEMKFHLTDKPHLMLDVISDGLPVVVFFAPIRTSRLTGHD